jgi:hypothetical protein
MGCPITALPHQPIIISQTAASAATCHRIDNRRAVVDKKSTKTKIGQNRNENTNKHHLSHPVTQMPTPALIVSAKN